METIGSLNTNIEQSIVSHWDMPALTDYHGMTLQYKDVARKIEKLHILFENSGIVQGDKIAICGRNSAHWAVAFMATITYGAVVVPVLHEFTTDQVYNIVNHSEARLLFVGDMVAASIDATKMERLEGIINLPDYSLLVARTDSLTYAREHLNELFGKRYPKVFLPSHVHYYIEQSPDELAVINYTSGTTSNSKGVMVPYRALWSNLDFALHAFGDNIPQGSRTVSILPMAHTYGMSFELIFQFCYGCHIFFLTRLPSPTIIANAFQEIYPALVTAVPLVIEKLVRKRIFPHTQNNRVRLLMNMPVISRKVKEKICEEVMNIFGGNVYEVVVGGAPFNREVEAFLKAIDFPITVIYGATECAPVITFADYKDFVPTSCGRAVNHLQVKIDSVEPQTVPGEIMAKGLNVMLGYYKNEEATREVLDDDGWYHTGDLATMDDYGYVYIKGRIKNMLLGSNGQNVYPEEIEDKLNSMPMVIESVIVQRDSRLVAIVYPDLDEARGLGLSEDDMATVMEQNRQELNRLLPAYSRLAEIVLTHEEFQKTPKRSIKRYLYS